MKLLEEIDLIFIIYLNGIGSSIKNNLEGIETTGLWYGIPCGSSIPETNAVIGDYKFIAHGLV